MPNVLAFDVGGTKTAWAVVTDDGHMSEQGTYATPQEAEPFLASLIAIIQAHPEVVTVGIGIAGTVSADHKGTLVIPNIPHLSHLELTEQVTQATSKPVALDNDGRCALIGEVWLGAARDTSSAVMLTLGTGVGGAVMQRHKILPHPTDLSLEISHLPADPADLYPAPSGAGTVEALLGGKNIEARYGVSLAEMAEKVRTGDAEAQEFWDIVSHAFHQCVRAIHQVYSCRMIVVGGRGVADLAYYLGSEEPACPVVPAELGSNAGIVGAARIALDLATEEAKDWDED